MDRGCFLWVLPTLEHYENLAGFPEGKFSGKVGTPPTPWTQGYSPQNFVSAAGLCLASSNS